MNKPDISPEAVERFAEYVTDAECKHGCGSMTFCLCALAADSVDMMRALSEALQAAEAEYARLRYVLGGVRCAIKTGRNEPLMIWKDQIDIALQEKPHD